MKKIYLTGFALLIGASTMFAQKVAKRILVEEFTNASCPPCASQNPAFNALLSQPVNTDRVSIIKYQWYFPGFDPMYEITKADVDIRDDYYAINGVPTAMENGLYVTDDCNAYDGAPACLSQAELDASIADSADIWVNVSHHISADYDSLYVTMVVKASNQIAAKATNSLKAHMIVTEEEISFSSSPGSNGETTFEHVMMKMLPTPNGASMPDTLHAGDSLVFTEVWEITGVYSEAELGVVGFVQDNSDKSILQSDYSEPNLTASTSYDVELVTTVLPANVCGDEITPSIDIKNVGGDPLTKLKIDYSINGGTMNTYNWTGTAVPFFGSYTIDLPATIFTPQANNTIDVTISLPNDSTDANALNNDASGTFAEAELANAILTLELKLDGYGSETAWTLKTSAGASVDGNSSYADNTNLYTEDIDLNTWGVGCYEFEITDSYGDGLSWNNAGYYTLKDANGKTLATGINFGYAEMTPFSIDSSSLSPDTTTGIRESVVGAFDLFPNPTNGVVNVALVLKNSANVSVNVYNAIGELVVANDLGTKSEGMVQQLIDLSGFNSGIYFVNVVAGENTASRKITLR